MELKSPSLYSDDFEIFPMSFARQKLIKLALDRDKAMAPALTSRTNKKIPCLSPTRNMSVEKLKSKRNIEKPKVLELIVKKRTCSPAAIGRNKENGKKTFKTFLLGLWKSTIKEKTFTKELFEEFKQNGFEQSQYKEKCTALSEEIKCLKIGKPYPSHVMQMIEDLAVLTGICTSVQIKKAKTTRSHEQELNKIVNSMTTNKIKAIQVMRIDSNLYAALGILIGSFMQFDKTVSVCDTFIKFLGNPGIAIKTMKKVIEGIKIGVLEKGKR